MENEETTAGEGQQENETQTGNESQEGTQDTQNQNQEDKTDWKAEALKFKAILDRNKEKNRNNKEPSKKSDDLDYGQKAFLIANGITADEFDLVRGELKQFNGELDSLISNNYFKSKLEENRQMKASDKATPSGNKRANQTSQDSVDYWLAKGELPPDFELRKKVVKARREKESNPFSTIFK